jgi:RES domain-containing protein
MDLRTVFRAVYVDFEADPLPSRSSMGRFHVGPVRITYLASSAETAWKEVVARWAADPVAFRMVEVEVTVTEIIDLTDPTVQSRYGVNAAQLTADDHDTCQQLGDRLKRAGVEAAWTYSAADKPDGRQLVVFLDNLQAGSSVTVVATRAITFPLRPKP